LGREGKRKLGGNARENWKDYAECLSYASANKAVGNGKPEGEWVRKKKGLRQMHKVKNLLQYSSQWRGKGGVVSEHKKLWRKAERPYRV